MKRVAGWASAQREKISPGEFGARPQDCGGGSRNLGVLQKAGDGSKQRTEDRQALACMRFLGRVSLGWNGRLEQRKWNHRRYLGKNEGPRGLVEKVEGKDRPGWEMPGR